MTMANRIGVMSDGVLLQVGTPGEIYEHPNCRFTAEFIGETNMFHGRLGAQGVSCADLRTPIAIRPDPGLAPGDEVSVSVRPERIVLGRGQHDPAALAGGGSGLNRAAGEVAEIAYLGSYSIYHVRLASGRTVIASVPSVHWGDAPPPTWGDPVWVSWKAPAGVVLRR